jgi:RNA polymerase sigma-70 factor (ECF subfamily)
MTSAALPLLRTAADALDARLRRVVAAHYDPVWRFLRRMGVPEGHVEDAAQQVLLVFSRRAAHVDEEAEGPFLFGTALRVASDFRRRAAQAREVTDDREVLRHRDSAPGADERLAQAELRRCLDRVLDAMSAEQRAVFVLAELDERTMAEIARLLAIPPGTVASRLRRAREVFDEAGRALRLELEQEVRP